MRIQYKEAFNMYLNAVSKKMGVSKKSILSKTKNRDATAARHMLWKLCKERPMTLAKITELMTEKGFKTSHTTILYGIRSMEKKFVDDINYESMFESLQ